MAAADSGGGTVLAFLNEVAGGRKLLNEIRGRVDAGASHVALAAPQNQPAAGQIVDATEIRASAQSRVDVTQAVLHDFGIEATASVLDEDPLLALDDAVRAFDPSAILISALPESRIGFLRRDLVETAKSRYDVPVVHVPVRIENDTIRFDVTHTLVVATQTVNSPDLLERLKSRHSESPHRYTFVCPASGEVSRETVCDNLAATLAGMYREEIDATGQPMSPEPFAAIENAIEHYRVDDVLISTFSGQKSKWLEDGLVEQVRDYTDKPVEHVESGSSAGAAEADRRVAVGAEEERG